MNTIVVGICNIDTITIGVSDPQAVIAGILDRWTPTFEWELNVLQDVQQEDCDNEEE